MNNGMNGRSKKELLSLLQELDFAINDAVLYLDAYPESGEALGYYQRLNTSRSDALEQYETRFGPLTGIRQPGERMGLDQRSMAVAI